ncbi:predicted protein [Postia placenta Mad-698-R]|nr:predicted protein [Postia placenta Mad-698-R]
MASFVPSQTDSRPTLPPLHALGLPDPRNTYELPGAHDSYDPHVQLQAAVEQMQLNDSQTQRSTYHGRVRQASVSSTTSSCTTSSRSSSPVAGSLPYPISDRISFKRTTFEDANAMMIVIPEVPPVPPLPGTPRTASNPAPGVWVVTGPAVELFRRHPERPVSKAARIHPYRISRISRHTPKPQPPPSA